MKPLGKVVFHPSIEKNSDYMHEKAVSQWKISSHQLGPGLPGWKYYHVIAYVKVAENYIWGGIKFHPGKAWNDKGWNFTQTKFSI